MARQYLKKATLTSTSDATEVHDTVKSILNEIELGGDPKTLEYAVKFDSYEGNVLLTKQDMLFIATSFIVSQLMIMRNVNVSFLLILSPNFCL